ncbi:MAG: hypothetical protein OXD36_05400 [Rhodobacter sp.]|nr:hypothetical protein [Rhodobacter sp.]
MAKTDTRQVQLHRKVHERLVKERDRRNSEGWSYTLSDVALSGLISLEKRRQPPRLNDLNIEILKGELLGAGLPPRRVEEAVGTLTEARDFYRRGTDPDSGPEDGGQPDQPGLSNYDFPGDRELIVEMSRRAMNRRAKDRLLAKGLARPVPRCSDLQS